MITIDRQSYVPAYLQLKEGILRDIREGTYLPGDRIPSIRDLVKASGLSHLTVAKAVAELIREEHLVSEKGKGTYVKGAGEEGHSAATQVVHLGVLGPAGIDSMYTPFSYEVMLGMNAAASRQGQRLYTMSVSDFLEGHGAPHIDGVIVMNADNCTDEARSCMKQTPTVLVRQAPGCKRANYVEASDYDGTAEAIRHLVELGHTRIAFSQHKQSVKSYADRYRAYCDVLSAQRLPLRRDLIVKGRQYADAGFKNMKRLLTRKQPPTAFFAGSDVEAVGAIRAAREASLNVPEDMSVVGFLNLEIFANFHPRLTTVSLPMKKMGWEAVRMLTEIIRGKREGPARVVLDAELIVRETTAPARVGPLTGS